MDVKLLVMDLLFGTPAAGPAVGARGGLVGLGVSVVGGAVVGLWG